MAEVLTRQALESTLGCSVFNVDRYREVFVHKSACRETGLPSYERLEFIGDSIIGFVVARYLFEKYPGRDEGFLTKARTKMVSGECLGRIARSLDLGKFVKMNEKAMQNGWANNSRILEDVFESLVGAMYYDLGLPATCDFLLGVFEKHVSHDDLLRDTNYKDALMRLAQQQGMPLPTYHVASDPQTMRRPGFEIVAQLGGDWYGRGRGPSKKAAEQQAAKHILALVNLLDASGNVIPF